jgi:hypothetical protein
MLFKNVNHFFQTADAFDSLLNDAVDLHVQVVDHRRNLAGAGIWQRPVTVAGFWQPKSSHLRRNPINLGFDNQNGRIPAIWQERSNPGQLVGIWLELPDFSRSDGIPARKVGFRPTG